jgi:hypothetical protein
MMRARHFLITLLLLPALAACRDTLSPYETTPVTLEKAQVDAISTGATPPDTIGICYNSLFDTVAQVRAVAEKACGPDTVPQAIERDFRLSHCPILQPARATFACLSKTP